MEISPSKEEIVVLAGHVLRGHREKTAEWLVTHARSPQQHFIIMGYLSFIVGRICNITDSYIVRDTDEAEAERADAQAGMSLERVMAELLVHDIYVNGLTKESAEIAHGIIELGMETSTGVVVNLVNLLSHQAADARQNHPTELEAAMLVDQMERQIREEG